MTFNFNLALLIAGIFLLGLPANSGASPPNGVGPCYKGLAQALNELESNTRRVSLIDGSEIINIHAYVMALESNPRWRVLAEKIKELRSLEAPKLNNRRNLYNTAKIESEHAKAPSYGYARMKKDALTLEGRTVDKAFDRFNPGQDFDVLNDGGKIVISPKNKVIGQDYVEIRYDFSGNYFRLQKGKFTGGKSLKFVSRDQQFIDWNGKIINTTGIQDNSQIFDELMKKSHWNAIRE